MHMTKLTHEQVRHIAKLARLNVSDSEVEKYATELGKIFAYVDMLREVDTKNVEPTAQIAGEGSSLRKDEVYKELLASPDALLATSPLPIEDHQIETPSAHG
jgi:aspartyl-tRNA(Asn)/glutamyl-tRNA(Gln) amidotransferase subunit C